MLHIIRSMRDFPHSFETNVKRRLHVWCVLPGGEVDITRVDSDVGCAHSDRASLQRRGQGRNWNDGGGCTKV